MVVGGVAALCGASYGLWKLSQALGASICRRARFGVSHLRVHFSLTCDTFAGKEKPITMTREWQEETNRRQREAKSNPIFGLSSEHPTGPGHVQSK